MPHAAHILLAAARDAERGRLAVMLADHGYRVSAAASSLTAVALADELHPDVVMFASSLLESDVAQATEALKAGARGRATGVVVIAPQPSESARCRSVLAGADDVIEGRFSDAVLLARLRPLCRLATMQAELDRRVQTARSLGLPVAAAATGGDTDSPCRVMLVARPGSAPERQVRDALYGGFDVSVESDPYRAGAVVADERFDAMVLSADRPQTAEPVLYLASHLRNNPSLFNLPVMMLHGDGVFADDGDPYRYGASIALGLPFEKSALAAGIRVLVRRQRQRWNIRGAYRAIHDAIRPGSEIELYPADFLRLHLDAAVEQAQREGRHLSVALFSLRNLGDIERKYFSDAGELLMAQAASWIASLVRTEDLVARLGDDEICVVLPDTTIEECRQVTQRIVAILSASDFNLTEEVMQPIRIWVDGACAAVSTADTPETLVSRARESLF
ncbi:MAG: diguanylate cyclase [Alphaproteobacteria bacterium]|nr:diguanylate cyclase [Alphaproteobacteria bacterium]